MIMKVQMIASVSKSLNPKSCDALPENYIGAEVSGSDGLQFNSEYPSLPPLFYSRTRRSPNEWREFQAETLKFLSLKEPDIIIPIAGQTSHIRDTSESDSLKSSLASPSRDLWEIAITKELESLLEAGTWKLLKHVGEQKSFHPSSSSKSTETQMERLNLKSTSFPVEKFSKI
jgi:hypothetical protein